MPGGTDLDQIFAALREGTDAESTEVLARLRLGDSDAEVILSLSDGSHSTTTGISTWKQAKDFQKWKVRLCHG